MQVLPKKVVITGAPGTGKTVVIKELESRGYHCYHEIIRDMTAAAKINKNLSKEVSNPLVFVADPLAFNKALLKGRESDFDQSLNIKDSICFFDRGIPDVLAYMDYFKQPYPTYFKTTCKESRYDLVFVLPPWKEIFKSDNERLESFKEAQEIHQQLLTTYKRFGYSPIELPKNSITERVSFVLETSL